MESVIGSVKYIDVKRKKLVAGASYSDDCPYGNEDPVSGDEFDKEEFRSAKIVYWNDDEKGFVKLCDHCYTVDTIKGILNSEGYKCPMDGKKIPGTEDIKSSYAGTTINEYISERNIIAGVDSIDKTNPSVYFSHDYEKMQLLLILDTQIMTKAIETDEISIFNKMAKLWDRIYSESGNRFNPWVESNAVAQFVTKCVTKDNVEILERIIKSAKINENSAFKLAIKNGSLHMIVFLLSNFTFGLKDYSDLFYYITKEQNSYLYELFEDKVVPLLDEKERNALTSGHIITAVLKSGNIDFIEKYMKTFKVDYSRISNYFTSAISDDIKNYLNKKYGLVVHDDSEISLDDWN